MPPECHWVGPHGPYLHDGGKGLEDPGPGSRRVPRVAALGVLLLALAAAPPTGSGRGVRVLVGLGEGPLEEEDVGLDRVLEGGQAIVPVAPGLDGADVLGGLTGQQLQVGAQALQKPGTQRGRNERDAPAWRGIMVPRERHQTMMEQGSSYLQSE